MDKIRALSPYRLKPSVQDRSTSILISGKFSESQSVI